jgi:pimeloyl-ACP methyl ester carboxylesterase
MFDEGEGPPLIVIPGVQGRWEWMRPGLDELRKHFRTISYTLCGDLGSGMRFDPAAGFENYIEQLDAVYEKCGIERASLCGVSYGGLIAVRYAATRPDRVARLVLVSSPAPGWAPSARQQAWIARPWRSVPAFVATAPARVWPEIKAACGTWRSQLTFALSHAGRVLAAPMIPSVMASRVTLQQGIDFTGDCLSVKSPTLIVTGEESLDSVVPVNVTRRYAVLIPGARCEMMERTGHLGMFIDPERFAQIVTGFIR